MPEGQQGCKGSGGGLCPRIQGANPRTPRDIGSIEQRAALPPEEGARVSFPGWFRQVSSQNGERFWALVLPDRPVVSSGHLGKLRSWRRIELVKNRDPQDAVGMPLTQDCGSSPAVVSWFLSFNE